MKGCFGTKEFSIKSRICKNCGVFGDCEKVAKRNSNKFILVTEEAMKKGQAMARA